ncbi:MAG: MFS transporter [Clostridia bacterium]|nr:MFS transporter [Oscillospiraceae bacterium]MBQ7830004.1 MFS transporter [Clostridia bacterium]
MKKKKILDANGKRKFGIVDSLAYAAGDFGCNMSFALKGTMAIFWTQFMRMDSILYAGLLILVQIWDAINDPLIGTIIDNDKKRKYKRGKFLAYIWLGSLGLLVAGALCFIPWVKNSEPLVKAIVFVAGYILWDAFYTIANVPYGSLLSVISNDPADRASLSAWRSIGSMIGNMVPMVILPMIIYDSNNNIIGERVFIAALIMGVAGFIAFQFMIRNTVIRVEENVTVSEAPQKFNVIKAMGNFMKNRPAVGATVAAMGMFIGMQAATTAVTVMFQSYFKNVAISGIVTMFAMIPIVAFTPLARKFVVKYGKKELSVVGAICSVVACAIMLLAPITPDGKGLVIYILCQLINSLGMGVYSTVSWSMMGDAIDYNEWKFGTREEGTVYSLHSFFRKLAQGIGPSLALVIMVALGYSEINAGNQLFSVALNMRYLVAALYLFAAVMQFIGLALIYNLDKKTLARMTADLNALHGANATESAENGEADAQ